MSSYTSRTCVYKFLALQLRSRNPRGSRMTSAMQLKAVANDVRSAILSEKGNACPLAIRLAWHASGTFDKCDGSGGSNGATMRFEPESTDDANAGLNIMRDMLEPIKAAHPGLSVADIWAIAGACACEFTGGPEIDVQMGRTDGEPASCPPNGRLPDASQGAQHLRDVFYRQGFNDREIVALSGAHTLGRCHLDRSGYEGKWTTDPLQFNNEYFVNLLRKKWKKREWDGPDQYEDEETGTLMMLPTDMALVQDGKFRPVVEEFASDEALFRRDFAAAFAKLLGNGCPMKSHARSYSGVRGAQAPAHTRSAQRYTNRYRSLDTGAGYLARFGGTDGMCIDAANRRAHKLDGLLPPAVIAPRKQLVNAMQQLRAKERPIDKYTYLAELQATNESLYYAILIEHTHEAMPVVYTPTVGEACQKYSSLFRRGTGLWITHAMAGRVKEALDQWPEQHVRCIVFTDGERILGLGDLGACGMGIPVGKLALYSALAGIHPRHCLPVTIDVGTNNKAFLADPGYIGIRAERQPVGEGSAYDELIREFIEAACAKWPGLLLQFEDFGNKNAFRLLKRYQPKCCCFNDDIQGTACVVLGGLYSALRQIKKTGLGELKFLFQGAGEAGCGIAELIATAIVEEAGGPSKLSMEQARRRVFLFDSKGLVVEGRPDGFRGRRGTLQHHKLPFAHTHAQETSFINAVRDIRPNVIIGVSAQPGVFDEEVCKAMAEINETPIIFPLSNPTHKAECTAEQAYKWTAGKCIFASGSPFDPVTYGGRTYEPGQGNNAYIFPGIGLGLLEAKANTCPDQVFIVAAQTLAETVTDSDILAGRMYPHLSRAREVSAKIAANVAAYVFDNGLAKSGTARPADLQRHMKSVMYQPFGGISLK